MKTLTKSLADHKQKNLVTFTNDGTYVKVTMDDDHLQDWIAGIGDIVLEIYDKNGCIITNSYLDKAHIYTYLHDSITESKLK